VVVPCRMDMLPAMMVGVLLCLGVSAMVIAMAMMPVMAVVRRLGMIRSRRVRVTSRLGFVVVMPVVMAAFMMSAVPVFVVVRSAVAMPMRPAVAVLSHGRVVGRKAHVHAQAVDAVSGVLADVQPEFVVQAKLGQFGPQEVGGNPKAEHGGQVHVAGYARETVVEQYFHGMPRRCAGLPGWLRRVMVGRWWGNRRGLSRGTGRADAGEISRGRP